MKKQYKSSILRIMKLQIKKKKTDGVLINPLPDDKF